MRHVFIDIGDKTMCQRCGNEVFRVDEECPRATLKDVAYEAGLKVMVANPRIALLAASDVKKVTDAAVDAITKTLGTCAS